MSGFGTLRAGDTVDIVAPASACSAVELERGLDAIREWGLVPRVPDDLFGDPYVYSNDDSVRLRQLRAAIGNRTSRAIWCVRGGYGSGRLLPRLGRCSPRALKPFIGFSDVTALHLFFNQVWGQPTWHGPVLTQLGSDRISPAALEELHACLFGRQTALMRGGLRPMNAAARQPGRVTGRLLGGNLKTLQSLIGTPFGLSGRGTILVLEDVDERGYAIDRMLVQLQQSGGLQGVKAILFGSFTGGLEANGRFVGDEVMERFAATMRVPVLTGLPLGHDAEARVLPLGVKGEIELGRHPCLRVAWSVCR